MRKKIQILIILMLGLNIIACNKKEIVDIENETNTIEFRFSNKEYDGIWEINSDYILIDENQNFKVIDYDENILIEDNYNFGLVFEEEEIIVLGNRTEKDEEFHLYDFNLNEVFTNKDYPDYKIIGIDNKVLTLNKIDNTEIICINMDMEYKELFRLNEEKVEKYKGSSAFSNNFAIIISSERNDEGYANLIDQNGMVYNLMDGEKYILTYADYSLNADKWVLCYEVGKDTSDITKGFYNIGSNIFKDLPEDIQSVEPLIKNNEMYYATSNNYALIKKDIDDNEIYIYNIMDERIVNSEPYNYVELNDYGKSFILYCKNSNEWGYLNSNFEETEMLYKDASSFNKSGMALINDGSGEYLINQQGEKLSEVITGVSAIAYNNIFIVNNDGQYKFLIIQ